MADQFKLTGDVTTTASSGAAGGFNPQLEASISERLTLSAKTALNFQLVADSAFSVDFGAITEAHTVIIKAVEGKVIASITTTDGASQEVPVDGLFILISKSTPVTAIQLTRSAGIDTTIRMFLGESAA